MLLSYEEGRLKNRPARCNPAPQSSISRNQTPATAGGDRRLSHQEIVAAREEIKIL
jgi:hypothetical protein